MTIWLVEMRGVYAHGITGVYVNEADARAGAEARASIEDGYHSFALMRAEMGEKPIDVSELMGKKVMRAGARDYERQGAYTWKEEEATP